MSPIQNSKEKQALTHWLLRFASFFIVSCLGCGLVLAQPLPKGNWKEIARIHYPLTLKVSTLPHFRVFRDKKGKPFLEGWLKDDQGKPVPNQPLVLLAPNGKKVQVRTDEKGLVVIPADGLPDRGSYTLRFLGSKKYTASKRLRALDFRRTDLTLEAKAPRVLKAGATDFVIRATLKYQGRPQSNLPLTLLLQGNRLLTLYSNRAGVVRFVWKGKALKGGASFRFWVVFAGNDFFLPQRIPLSVSVAKKEGSFSLTKVLLQGFLLFLTVFLLAALAMRTLAKKRKEEERARKSKESPLKEYEKKRQQIRDALFDEIFDDYEVAGVLMDAGENKRASGIVVRVKLLADEKGRELETYSDGYGRFSVKCEDYTGEVEIVLSHPHYEIKSTRLALPHTGTGRVLQIALYSYRHLIYETFVYGVRLVTGEGSFSPRKETVRNLLARLGPSLQKKLTPLAMSFEKAYYGAHTPKVADYTLIRNMFESLKD